MRRFMVLRSDARRFADYVESEKIPRIKRYYELGENEVFRYPREVDPFVDNIVAVAIVDGSAAYPTRWNRIVTGEHMNPFGPRGGLNGCAGCVVRIE